jgi:hypothetical protein
MPDQKPQRFPLIVDPQNRLNATSRDPKLVNGFMEKKKSGQVWVYKRPGLVVFSTPGVPE